MEFSKEFMADMAEALEQWKAEEVVKHDDPKVKVQIATMSLEQWVVGYLQTPIYALIGRKRARNAIKEPEKAKRRAKR
jgi:hypothetical protein